MPTPLVGFLDTTNTIIRRLMEREPVSRTDFRMLNEDRLFSGHDRLDFPIWRSGHAG